jgi:hypothetical protein
MGGSIIQTALPGSRILRMQKGIMERWNIGRMGFNIYYSNIPGDFNNAGVIDRR